MNQFFYEYESNIKPQNKRIYHNPLSCLYIAYKYGHKKAISNNIYIKLSIVN